MLQVSGRNEMGRWDGDGGDHHLVWHGLQLGWATWRRAWRAVRDVGLSDDRTALDLQLARWDIDPLVREHYQMRLTLAAAGGQSAWDERWWLQRALLGGLSVVPPVNLVAHEGFDEDATHCRNAADIRGLVPVGRAPERSGGTKLRPDNRLDRWSLLIQLMSTFRDPRCCGDCPGRRGSSAIRSCDITSRRSPRPRMLLPPCGTCANRWAGPVRSR